MRTGVASGCPVRRRQKTRYRSSGTGTGRSRPPHPPLAELPAPALQEPHLAGPLAVRGTGLRTPCTSCRENDADSAPPSHGPTMPGATRNTANSLQSGAAWVTCTEPPVATICTRQMGHHRIAERIQGNAPGCFRAGGQRHARQAISRPLSGTVMSDCVVATGPGLRLRRQYRGPPDEAACGRHAFPLPAVSRAHVPEPVG